MTSMNDELVEGSESQMGLAAQVVRRDFETREFVQIVQMNVMKLVEFINNFDHSMRYKLACLNEKLHKLEKTLEFCESVSSAVEEEEEYEDPASSGHGVVDDDGEVDFE